MTVSSRTTRDALEALRPDFAVLHRLMAMDGLQEGSWGHMSLTCPAGVSGGTNEFMLLSPGQTHWSQVTPENLLVVDRAGHVVAGEGYPNPSAWAIHQAVQDARPDIGCIIHTHPPQATALTLHKSLAFETRADQNAAAFHGKVACLDHFDGVVLAEEEGRVVAEALGNATVLFMANHGILVAETDVAFAYTRMTQLERACLFQNLARAGGGELGLMSEEAARSVAAYRGADAREHFAAMRQVLASVGRSLSAEQNEALLAWKQEGAHGGRR